MVGVAGSIITHEVVSCFILLYSRLILKMVVILSQLVLFVAILLIGVPAAWNQSQSIMDSQDSTDDCCYWYTTVPSNVSCSIDGYQVTIPCTILTRRDPYTSVTVRWYWLSEDQESAGVRGTLLTNSSKYLLLYNPANASSNNESGPDALFNDHYILTIQNFTTSDFGYYWFQIVVNDTCLLYPSSYGHITENTTASGCSTTILHSVVHPPQCAGSDSFCTNTSNTCSPTTAAGTQSTSVTLMPTRSSPTEFANTSTQCTSVMGMNTVNSSTAVAVTTSTTEPATNSTTMGLCTDNISNDMSCIVAITGGAVFFAIILIVMCVGVCICFRRRKRKKVQQTNIGVQGKNKPEDLEAKNTLSNDNSNGTTILASQQGEQVPAVVGTETKSEASHTYDSVDLESIRNTNTLKPTSTSNSAHTYKATPGQPQVSEAKTKTLQVPATRELSPIAEYDVVEGKGSLPLYSDIRENTVHKKRLNHAKKDTNGKHQYDKVNPDICNKSGSPPVVPNLDKRNDMAAGHVYHVLEDSSKEQNPVIITEDEYSAPQPHQLVLPNNSVNNTSPDGRGVVEAVGNITTPKKNALTSANEDGLEAMYDEPITTLGQAEVSVSTSKPAGPMFDDPHYEKGYPSSEKAASNKKAAALAPPSALNGVPEPPPRVESCHGAPRFNNYDDATELIKTPVSSVVTASSANSSTAINDSTTANNTRRERDYELTELMREKKLKGGTKGIFDDPSYETTFLDKSKQ